MIISLKQYCLPVTSDRRLQYNLQRLCKETDSMYHGYQNIRYVPNIHKMLAAILPTSNRETQYHKWTYWSKYKTTISLNVNKQTSIHKCSFTTLLHLVFSFIIHCRTISHSQCNNNNFMI